VQPKVNQRVVLAADEVVVLARLDDQEVARLDRLADAVDLDPPLTLEEAERLLILVGVGTVLVVGHQARSVERDAAGGEAGASQEAGENVRVGSGLPKVGQSIALHDRLSL
jgi:predicted transcriptional regulator